MNYIIRELELEDLRDERGFFETMSNLSEVGNISSEKKEEIFNNFKKDSFVYVAVDNSQVIGTVKLLVEDKFCHNGSCAGHIEDVVTRKGFEGQGIARSLINKAMAKAKEIGCYKVILSSDNSLVPFYKKFGFYEFEITMRVNL
ncbi:MAG: GNAT family N-acetyltransferase [Patescibacteria group bacterium]|nr:GNAT family N-acetyltransferase [Patescibacteria group bacterium]MDD4610930.1 GNAT family N-acetyltransferase [Patescibacteria group bacterium]